MKKNEEILEDWKFNGNFKGLIKWGASSRWSFRPNFARALYGRRPSGRRIPLYWFAVILDFHNKLVARTNSRTLNTRSPGPGHKMTGLTKSKVNGHSSKWPSFQWKSIKVQGRSLNGLRLRTDSKSKAGPYFEHELVHLFLTIEIVYFESNDRPFWSLRAFTVHIGLEDRSHCREWPSMTIHFGQLSNLTWHGPFSFDRPLLGSYSDTIMILGSMSRPSFTKSPVRLDFEVHWNDNGKQR